MKQESIDYTLKRIQTEWHNIAIYPKPWGVWIRQCSPVIDSFTEGLDTHSSIQRVWFLTKDGISPRNVWEYLRMIVVQVEQPWCQKMGKEQSIWSTTRCHEIGLAGFAEYENSGDLYLEVIWGGLFGLGWRISIGDDGVILSEKELWIS